MHIFKYMYKRNQIDNLIMWSLNEGNNRYYNVDGNVKQNGI